MSNFGKLLAYFSISYYSNNRGRVKSVIYPSIDKLLNVVSSKYELVHIAAKRSRQIKETNFLQMPSQKYKSAKNIGKALEEVAEGLIIVKHQESGN